MSGEGVSRKQDLRQRISSAQRALDGARKATQAHHDTDFWRTCVRDTTGRWQKYADVTSMTGVRYFHGVQPKVDYASEKEVRYLRNNIEVRAIFYGTLMSVPDMDVSQFQAWLELLRRTLEYRPTETWLHETFVTPTHTPIVLDDVLPIAKAHKDPYYTGQVQGPIFPEIPPLMLPEDVPLQSLIYHHYPDVSNKDPYLETALISLQRALFEHAFGSKEYLHEIAYFYQVLLNLHLFAGLNASLYTNMANGLLALANIRGIEHGIMDFVAMRLQPKSFQRYFLGEVEVAQNV